MTPPMPVDPLAQRWHPTRSLARAGIVGALAAAYALVGAAPSVMVLAAPLVIWTCLGIWHRPGAIDTPAVDSVLDHGSVHEGQGTTSRLSLTDASDVEQVIRVMSPAAHVATGTPAARTSG